MSTCIDDGAVNDRPPDRRAFEGKITRSTSRLHELRSYEGAVREQPVVTDANAQRMPDVED
ncbi:MAG: hypothetical protein R3D26_13115 [Cyanobacteriota/Melainabacteria group bacterium]